MTSAIGAANNVSADNNHVGDSGEDAASRQQPKSFMKSLQSNKQQIAGDSSADSSESDDADDEKAAPLTDKNNNNQTNTDDYMRRISDEDRKLEEREEKVKQELDLVRHTLDDAEKRLLDMKARFDMLERETDQLSKRIAEFAADEEEELTKLKNQIDKDYPTPPVNDELNSEDANTFLNDDNLDASAAGFGPAGGASDHTTSDTLQQKQASSISDSIGSKKPTDIPIQRTDDDITNDMPMA